MKIYYINNDKCVDVNNKSFEIVLKAAKIAPSFIVGVEIANLILSIMGNVVGTGCYVYGLTSLAEFMDILPKGMTESTCKKIYEIVEIMIQNGMVR